MKPYRIRSLKINVNATSSSTTLTNLNGLKGKSIPVTNSQRASLASQKCKRHLRRTESQLWNMLKRCVQRRKLMILLPFYRTIVVPAFGSLACVKILRQTIAKKRLLKTLIRLITYSTCSKTLSSLSLVIAMTLVESIPLRSQRCPNQ